MIYQMVVSHSYRSLPHASNSRRKYPQRTGVMTCLGSIGAISRTLA
jgi:hypothetical protein